MANLQDLMKLFGQQMIGPNRAPQQGPVDFLQQYQQGQRDPVDDRNRFGALPGNAANPFDNGFFKGGASTMTPEARLASEGASAMNQWGQLGGVEGIDPTKLGGFMGAKTIAGTSAPPRTDYGAVQQPMRSPAAPAPQVGSWVQEPDGWALVGPSLDRPGEGGGNVLDFRPNATGPETSPFVGRGWNPQPQPQQPQQPQAPSPAPVGPRNPLNGSPDITPEPFVPRQQTPQGPTSPFRMPRPTFDFGTGIGGDTTGIEQPLGSQVDPGILRYLMGWLTGGTPAPAPTPAPQQRRDMPPRGGF